MSRALLFDGKTSRNNRFLLRTARFFAQHFPMQMQCKVRIRDLNLAHHITVYLCRFHCMRFFNSVPRSAECVFYAATKWINSAFALHLLDRRLKLWDYSILVYRNEISSETTRMDTFRLGTKHPCIVICFLCWLSDAHTFAGRRHRTAGSV